MACSFEYADETYDIYSVDFPGDLCIGIKTHLVFRDPARLNKKGRRKLVNEWLKIEQKRNERIHQELLEQYVETDFP